MTTNRKARRQDQRRAKAKHPHGVAPARESFFSRLSTDWIVGGIILAVVALAALIYTISVVFAPSAGQSDVTQIKQVFSLAASPSDPRTMFLGDVGGLFRSTDGGKKWERQGVSNLVQKVYADPNDPKILYAATATGVLKSADGGQGWSQMTSNLPGGSTTALAADPLDSSKQFAFVGARGLYKSEDGGKTWDLKNPVDQASLTALAVKPGAPDAIYAFHTTDGFVVSVDNGRRFDSIGEGLPRLSVTDLLTMASEPNTVYAAAGRGVYKSTDSGRTWKQAGHGLNNIQVIALTYAPASKNLYATDTAGAVYVSADSGQTWQPNP